MFNSLSSSVESSALTDGKLILGTYPFCDNMLILVSWQLSYLVVKGADCDKRRGLCNIVWEVVLQKEYGILFVITEQKKQKYKLRLCYSETENNVIFLEIPPKK